MFLLGAVFGAALLLAGALGVFGQGDEPSNTIDDSDR